MDNSMTFLNACRNGQKAIVQIFLRKGGFDINRRDAGGNSSLHYACAKGHRDIASLLTENGADTNLPNNVSETPLHLAAAQGNKEILDNLLRHGAQINVTDKEGRTPLLRALGNKRTDAALFLLSQGADTEQTDAEGHKAIDYATAYGLREIMTRLPMANTSDSAGNTPLHQAVYNDQRYLRECPQR